MECRGAERAENTPNNRQDFRNETNLVVTIPKDEVVNVLQRGTISSHATVGVKAAA